jgi:hypothetical protein
MNEDVRASWRLYILMMTPDGVFDTSYREPLSIRGELDSLVRQTMADQDLPKVVSCEGKPVPVIGWEIQLETEQFEEPSNPQRLLARTTLIYTPIIGMLQSGEYMTGGYAVRRHEIAQRLAMPCVSPTELAIIEQMVRALVSGDHRTPSARRPSRSLKPVIRFADEVDKHRTDLYRLLSGEGPRAN